GDDPGRGGADLDGPAGGLLDDPPVHHRVGERDPDLDGVGTGVGHRPHDVEPGRAEPAGHVGHEQLPALLPPGPEVSLQVHSSGSPRRSATWWASLSPRPDSVTSTVAPAGISDPAASASQPRAWAGSRAGTIPSLTDRSLNPSRAWASVQCT